MYTTYEIVALGKWRQRFSTEVQKEGLLLTISTLCDQCCCSRGILSSQDAQTAKIEKSQKSTTMNETCEFIISWRKRSVALNQAGDSFTPYYKRSRAALEPGLRIYFDQDIHRVMVKRAGRYNTLCEKCRATVKRAG